MDLPRRSPKSGPKTAAASGCEERESQSVVALRVASRHAGARGWEGRTSVPEARAAILTALTLA